MYCAEPCNVCHGARTVPVVVEMVTAERVTCPQCDGEWGWTNPTDYGTGREDDACAYCEKGTVPAGIVLTGAVEALPVVGVDNNLKDDEVAVVVFVQWIAIREQVGPKKWLYTHIDHHFGDRPRLKVGDTAWRIRRDVRQFFEEARKP